MKRLSQILFVLGTIVSVTAVVFVASGVVDSLSNNGAASEQVAYLWIGLFLVVGAGMCWCGANFRF